MEKSPLPIFRHHPHDQSAAIPPFHYPGQNPAADAVVEQLEEHLATAEVLEKPGRISRSKIWQLQELFYRDQVEDAWHDRTPFFVTNSVFIAEAYADILISFLRDCPEVIDPGQPLEILEIGAGLGRLGFLLARELKRKLQYFPRIRDLRFRIVLTDFHSGMIEFWKKQPSFGPLLNEGVLDLGVFRPGVDHEIRLEISRRTLSAGNLKNPLIVVANYLFDSLPQDQFQMREGQLHECLFHIVRKADLRHSTVERLDIRDVVPRVDYRPVADPGSYYERPEWNELLAAYARQIRQGGFIMPTGALECIDNLRRFSGDNWLLLSSDKGYTFLQDMAAYMDHPYTTHQGAFSYAVNFHGIGRYFLTREGHYYHTSHKLLNTVQTVLCLDLKEIGPEHPLPNLQYCFGERIDRANAINTVSEMHGLLSPQAEKLGFPLESLLGFVKLNLYDPKSLGLIARRLTPFLANLSLNERIDLVITLERVWENYFHFKGEANLPFWMGHLYYHLGLYDRALDFFRTTIRLYGEDDVLHFLRGMCLEGQGLTRAAIQAYKKAVALNPELEEARQRLEELTAQAR